MTHQVEREDFERLADPEDQAQRVADMFREAALADQLRRAELAPRGKPGVCSNCAQACLPTAIYCDEDCRDDHEARLRAVPRLRGS